MCCWAFWSSILEQFCPEEAPYSKILSRKLLRVNLSKCKLRRKFVVCYPHITYNANVNLRLMESGSGLGLGSVQREVLSNSISFELCPASLACPIVMMSVIPIDTRDNVCARSWSCLYSLSYE